MAAIGPSLAFLSTNAPPLKSVVVTPRFAASGSRSLPRRRQVLIQIEAAPGAAGGVEIVHDRFAVMILTLIP